jgi:5-methylcytosine-specific restriction endonuclease McrA
VVATLSVIDKALYCPRCRVLFPTFEVACPQCGRVAARQHSVRLPFVRYDPELTRPRSGSKSTLARRLKVAARDGWLCHLCGEPVDPAGQGEDAPSIDHVVPRSRGGSSRQENLRLAHKRCNNARGSAPLG